MIGAQTSHLPRADRLLFNAPVRLFHAPRRSSRRELTKRSRFTPLQALGGNPVREIVSGIASNIYKAQAALQPEEMGESVLWRKIKRLDLDGVQAALDAGNSADEKGADGDTPLLYIARAGHYKYPPTEIPQSLINAGADLDVKDKRGLTALQVSLLSGWQNIAEVLIQNGADTSGVAAIKGQITCPDCKRLVLRYEL